MHTKLKVISNEVRFNQTKRSKIEPKWKPYIVAADLTLYNPL